MADLHSALKSLSPCKWSDVPQSEDELDRYLQDLFNQAHLVLESVPIEEPHARPRSESSVVNASNITTSSARSPPPPLEYAELQKEWGKPVKLGVKENPMGISVYKTSAKDGRGAWFARRSVHAGLGFAKFKKALEHEFPASLAVKGGPGEGKVRGIGAETRVEDVSAPVRGRAEVFRLTAQFPGPTTPRDFVTLLATSDHAVRQEADADGKAAEFIPKHYMIISKPCDHAETQPQNGFIRGWYESIEFIREVPRQLKVSQSSTDLTDTTHDKTETLERQAILRGGTAKNHTGKDKNDADHSQLRVNNSTTSGEQSKVGRKRSATEPVPPNPNSNEISESRESDDNPVEWIMVTRSDPGGSVPRFMVERGTPAGICDDARKFLEWAAQLEDETDGEHYSSTKPIPNRRESIIHWEEATEEVLTDRVNPENTEHSGIFATVTGVVSAYTPQIILSHLPQTIQHSSDSNGGQDVVAREVSGTVAEDDSLSTTSSISFASAASQPGSEENPSISSKSLNEKQAASQSLSEYEKQLLKLFEKKKAFEAKIAGQREQASKQIEAETEKERAAQMKADEKLDQELKKQEEKYRRELAKIEQKKVKAAQKAEERKRKLTDRDEKNKLTRERDEARAELDLLRKERQIWQQQIGELQKENTDLAAKIGKLERGSSGTLSGSDDDKMMKSSTDKFRARHTVGGRSRSSSWLSLNKQVKE